MGSAVPVTTMVSFCGAGCVKGCVVGACWAHNSPVHAAAMIQNFIWETPNVASATPNVIDLWTIPLDQPRSALCLSEDEAIRAARFRFEKDRAHWVTARSALRTVLATYMESSPESLRFIYNEHGKPALEHEGGIEFNLSHAGDFGLIAVSRSAAVGVDIERIRQNVDIAALLRRLGETDLQDTIPELFQRWTRREALSKAAGGELFNPPSPDLQAFNIPAPEGYTAAVATHKVPATLTIRSL